MFDKIISFLLTFVCVITIGFFLFSLVSCQHLNTAAKATKGVVRIYKEAENKIDDLHKYCAEVHAFLSSCPAPECSRMLVRHIHFCNSADSFMREIQEVKDDIISEAD